MSSIAAGSSAAAAVTENPPATPTTLITAQHSTTAAVTHSASASSTSSSASAHRGTDTPAWIPPTDNATAVRCTAFAGRGAGKRQCRNFAIEIDVDASADAGAKRVCHMHTPSAIAALRAKSLAQQEAYAKVLSECDGDAAKARALFKTRNLNPSAAAQNSMSRISSRQNRMANPFSFRDLPPPLVLATLFTDPSLPLIIDVGCARGRWVAALARADGRNMAMSADVVDGRHFNFLGIELRPPLVDDANAAAAADPSLAGRCAYVSANASAGGGLVTLLRSPAVCEQLRWLAFNFPDPWARRKHRKRRIVTAALVTELRHTLHAGTCVYTASDVLDVARDMRARFRCDDDGDDDDDADGSVDGSEGAVDDNNKTAAAAGVNKNPDDKPQRQQRGQQQGQQQQLQQQPQRRFVELSQQSVDDMCRGNGGASMSSFSSQSVCNIFAVASQHQEQQLQNDSNLAGEKMEDVEQREEDTSQSIVRQEVWLRRVFSVPTERGEVCAHKGRRVFRCVFRVVD